MNHIRIKRIIIALLLIVFSFFLTACSSKTEIISTSSSDVVTTESYYLFRTYEAENYLQFLKELDYTQYEIVDVSISKCGTTSNDCFFVTYKTV